jgi:hypothetical protein
MGIETYIFDYVYTFLVHSPEEIRFNFFLLCKMEVDYFIILLFYYFIILFYFGTKWKVYSFAKK